MANKRPKPEETASKLRQIEILMGSSEIFLATAAFVLICHFENREILRSRRMPESGLRPQHHD
ncbi:hypothetical protein HW561_18570 [Rhodobacteraceae bacterium B1Z28]|uniref:Uncharacterized protein n=1 Tax=Ruegeria haliotis TaxID=2747601 RepID=A0ABX2PUH3_9RHOB|nr:hypothetical protein [Ruegeria haliotis]NVO57806.1 hypothetical protein [Ruegeria haliotis]